MYDKCRTTACWLSANSLTTANEKIIQKNHTTKGMKTQKNKVTKMKWKQHMTVFIFCFAGINLQNLKERPNLSDLHISAWNIRIKVTSKLQSEEIAKDFFCMLWKVTMWVGGVQNVRRCLAVRQRYTYRALQTIQMKLIHLCVWAEPDTLNLNMIFR